MYKAGLTFLKMLFKKDPVKKLPGGGLILSDDQQQFYIDSVTHVGLREKSITIFREEIRKIFNNDYNDTSERTQLIDLEKNMIALKTKKLLEAEGFKVMISPEFPIEFSIRHK